MELLEGMGAENEGTNPFANLPEGTDPFVVLKSLP